MLSPAIITLPWRPDAAEHYFAPLSALPWAMLLHSALPTIRITALIFWWLPRAPRY